MVRKITVSSVGPQDATDEDSLAHLPGRVLGPAPGLYASLPGRARPKSCASATSSFRATGWPGAPSAARTA
eukprot:14385325-Alexandrium_andersonii.AAC.1